MTRNVGKYQLVRKLATGGMAEVFLAKAAGPRGFEKTLVVKCILPHLAQEPSFVEMFHSEAMLAARLSHPHVVQIFDFGEVEGSYFIAMEYIDGPSLRTLIKRASAQRIPLPPAVCARLISQACEGLAFAHDFVDVGTGQPLGLIHRDVSPDNLLLSLQGSVKVVDFGIAKATGQGHQTASGVVKGKLAYMPPEQLRGKSLDRRVDVYALGVVLYELLTFHKPHAAANEAALMHSILFDAPVPAEHHRPDLPESLRRILARATAKDREQRYPDCHALQADLEDFIHSEGRLVTAQQVAQLIQRATAGAGVPVQPPSLVPTRLAPVAPGPTRPALEPSAPEPLARTELDTTPEAPRSEDDWRTQQETSPFGGRGGSMGVPQDASRFPASPAWTREPTRTQPELDARWRPSRWTRRALVGAVLVLTGTGLVWEARGRMVDRSEATPAVAPPPARAEVTPTPAQPAPAQPTPAPLSEEPGATAEAAPSETAPEAKPPEARQRSARPPKAARRSAAVVRGLLDVRSQPYAHVSVDGRSVGTTPLDEPVELAPGSYTVKLYSPTLARTEVRRVEVTPGKTTPLNVSFPKER